ncbi:adenosylmethionine--8-amino-7-oxononanoate transaminase [Nocardioides pocheonensis]|uniref:Adenosylmethionine-8-amino-7-oxononanoate aminotransferase n=1 Tax=Nocardioides pocheonensis TaxID=661485 RepID=A0A3N0GP69_9ACTN|nr:adenosylmethionine--8-amino-7-oxononanoate transaminase [Nocardioides pocheonensis]RNM14264.1 adenosylmethionine--8-amino-7-oxononanoate transaminase [Nocardioides pocheonensis]
MSPEVSRLAALAPQPPEARDLLAFDREHLWHPYSSMTAPGAVRQVESASGVRLRMRVDGEPVEVVDAMSSWWCAIHGYAVPELDAAAVEQLGRMSHVMFGGLTHEPAVRLGRQLVDLAPGPAAGEPGALEKVFFADSGSVSVEVAMKMAWQAHAAGGLTRTKFFTIRGGYHGDTFSPMSVTDPEGGMHAMYAGFLPRHVFADRPPAAGEPLDAWTTATTALFEEHADEIAAVIVEPVLQGAGGMHVYGPEAVRHLAALARAHGALVIFDEIATGLWRTGAPWAADHAGVTPDILCTGKALTGGYLTLAAVLTTAEVAARVDASPAGAMMHGPTFMANPLACAIASANLDLLASYDVAGTIERLSAGLRTGLAPAAGFRSVADVRVLGAVGVIELQDAVDVARVTAAALDRGVWVRPFRNLVYTMPPYVTSDDDLDTITRALVGAVEEVHGA